MQHHQEHVVPEEAKQKVEAKPNAEANAKAGAVKVPRGAKHNQASKDCNTPFACSTSPF